MKGTLIVIGACLLLALVSVLAPVVINSGFDAIDLALGWSGALLVVVLISLATGVLFLLMFPHVSAQGAIKTVKDKIKYNLLGIRIYQDNISNVVKSTGGTLGWNFGYLGLNVLPMLILFIPFMVIWFQMNALYAFDPLKVDDEKLLAVDLKEGVDPTQVTLEPAAADADGGPGWSVVKGPVRVAHTSDGHPKILWMIRANREGVFDLKIHNGSETVTKVLAVGARPRRLAKVRTAHPWANFFAMKDPLVYFGEPVLSKDSFVQTAVIDYPAAEIGGPFSGEMGTMLVFVIVSLVSAFALKGVFGVEI